MAFVSISIENTNAMVCYFVYFLESERSTWGLLGGGTRLAKLGEGQTPGWWAECDAVMFPLGSGLDGKACERKPA